MCSKFSRQFSRGINSCFMGRLDLTRWASALTPTTIQSICSNAEVIEIKTRFCLTHGHFKSMMHRFLHQICLKQQLDLLSFCVLCSIDQTCLILHFHLYCTYCGCDQWEGIEPELQKYVDMLRLIPSHQEFSNEKQYLFAKTYDCNYYFKKSTA
jgi:hypothetical protein